MITNEIGLNAGKIWSLLNETGNLPVKEMVKKLKLSTSDFYLAMGWLAREEKVYHFENEGVLMVCLRE